MHPAASPTDGPRQGQRGSGRNFLRPFLPGGAGWRALTPLVDVALAACPRRWRFPAALRLTLLLQPLVRRRSVYPKWRLTQLDSYREETLRFVVNRMSRLRLGFDPEVNVVGAEKIGEGGVVIASGHFFTNHFMLRWLHDRKRRVTVVMRFPPKEPKVPGKDEPLEVIEPGPNVLMEIRRRVAGGGVVWIALDSAEPRAKRSRRLETSQGVRYVSDTFMRFVERAGIPLLFCATRVDEDGTVAAEVVSPVSKGADGLHDEFCRFLVAHAGK